MFHFNPTNPQVLVTKSMVETETITTQMLNLICNNFVNIVFFKSSNLFNILDISYS